MSRPELTPGNGGGGKPTKPESENVWQFPWLIPQPPPEPIPDRPPLPIEPPPEPEPEVTSVTPMINLVPTNPPAPPSTVQQPQPEPTSEPARPPKVRLGERILRRNEERARQDAVSQSRERSTVDDLQDLERYRGTNTSDPAKMPQFPASLGEASKPVTAKTFGVMTGRSLDDEEQDVNQEWEKFLRTVDPNVSFMDEPWYTTWLGPTPSSAISPFQNSYIDIAFADGQGILQPGRRVSNGTPAESSTSVTQTTNDPARTSDEDDERWYRVPETELHPYVQHALANTFSSREWNDEWRRPEHLEEFLKGRLAPFFIKEYLDSLPWDELTDIGMIGMYYSILEPLWEEHWTTDSARDLWVDSLDAAFAEAYDLLSAVAAVPLVNEARLVEEFVYANVEEAQDDLRAHVQYAYEKFGIRPPEDLHDWSASRLANELYSLLTNVFEPYYEDSSDAENFQKAYEFIADPDFDHIYRMHPYTITTRLDGSHRESPMELVFFVASFFIEPLDWGLTAQDMVSAAEDEDWWQFFLSGAFGILPIVSGRAAKGLSKSDDILDASRRIDVENVDPNMFKYGHDIDPRVLRTSQIRTRNDLINRGLRDDVVDEMLSGNATLPSRGQGKREIVGLTEDPNLAAKPSRLDIQVQNDTIQFLTNQGYDVISLGPDPNRRLSNPFRQQMYEIIGYSGSKNPDIVIIHHGLDGVVQPRVFDIYSPRSEHVENIRSGVRRKVNQMQTDRIVLNMQQSSADIASVRRSLQNQPPSRLKEVIIVDLVDDSLKLIDVVTLNS